MMSTNYVTVGGLYVAGGTVTATAKELTAENWDVITIDVCGREFMWSH